MKNDDNIPKKILDSKKERDEDIKKMISLNENQLQEKLKEQLNQIKSELNYLRHYRIDGTKAAEFVQNSTATTNNPIAELGFMESAFRIESIVEFNKALDEKQLDLAELTNLVAKDLLNYAKNNEVGNKFPQQYDSLQEIIREGNWGMLAKVAENLVPPNTNLQPIPRLVTKALQLCGELGNKSKAIEDINKEWETYTNQYKNDLYTQTSNDQKRGECYFKNTKGEIEHIFYDKLPEDKLLENFGKALLAKGLNEAQVDWIKCNWNQALFGGGYSSVAFRMMRTPEGQQFDGKQIPQLLIEQTKDAKILLHNNMILREGKINDITDQMEYKTLQSTDLAVDITNIKEKSPFGTYNIQPIQIDVELGKDIRMPTLLPDFPVTKVAFSKDFRAENFEKIVMNEKVPVNERITMLEFLQKDNSFDIDKNITKFIEKQVDNGKKLNNDKTAIRKNIESKFSSLFKEGLKPEEILSIKEIQMKGLVELNSKLEQGTQKNFANQVVNSKKNNSGMSKT